MHGRRDGEEGGGGGINHCVNLTGITARRNALTASNTDVILLPKECSALGTILHE